MKKVCRLLLLLALAVLAADVRAQTKLEIANPSFEEGMVGHWTSSPGIMRVDTSRAARGAHSLRVAPGDRIESGAALAEVGNSGQTMEPHLHIHAQRPAAPGAAPISGAPLPLLIGGAVRIRGDMIKGGA